MHSFSPWLTACGLAAGLLVAACGEKETTSAPPAAPPTPTQGVEGFYNPQADESWTYTGTRDFPPDTKFGPDDEERILDLPDGARRLEFERRRVCTGLYRPEGSDRDLTTFEIFEDETLSEREVYDITSEGVVGRGWAPAGIPLAKGVLVTPGIKIASVDMAGGQSWQVPSENPNRTFQLDVIERAEITVPAGTFEAARLRVTVTGNDHTTKRTVWFAENVGIVKEEVIHYEADRIGVREQLELVQWVLPTLAGGKDTKPKTPALPRGSGRFTEISLKTPLGPPPTQPDDGAAEDELVEHPYEGALSFPPDETEEVPVEDDAESTDEAPEITDDDTVPGEDQQAAAD